MLQIKVSHKPIKDYYAALKDFEKHGISHETSVRNAFQELLTTYARKLKWSFLEEYQITLANGNKGSVDGALVDPFSIPMGHWEAKDSKDDLAKEVGLKFAKGYPQRNIMFQEPLRAILYQDGRLIDDYDLREPEQLVRALDDFFGYHAEEESNWAELVEQFKKRIPESAQKLIEMIEEEKRANKRFQTAFQGFAELCRASINPNLSDAAIEEMLVQHLLTSRIFAKVFNDPDFVRRNVIASEIEKVIDALTSRSFTRDDFFQPLEYFYRALENRAQKITDWSEKQSFLNTVYEKFFQGFAVKVADTHGIVYTPQPIVDFMVRSVQHILKTEFNRSLADEGVHILDPFVGTGNFILRIMREIAAQQKSKLPKKYAKELHCNEVMLLPYYIAAMNIEHEFYSQVGRYEPFEGICLVDTFELAEPSQTSLFSTENTERVERQKKSPIFVIIGNPPYNANQQDENDNNKNRRYPIVDKRVAETYAKASSATLVTQLGDPYVKAYRYATDRIGDEGIVALVSNNSFLDALSFDGMRKHLYRDFDAIYLVDLKGNVRRDSMRDGIPIGEKHTVFGLSAMVGIAIAFLVKKRGAERKGINYSDVHFRATRKEKFEFLRKADHVLGLEHLSITPDKKGNWINKGDEDTFDTFPAMGSKEGKRDVSSPVIFKSYSNGIKTNSDSYTYSFLESDLSKRAKDMVDNYQSERLRWIASGRPAEVESVIRVDEQRLKWIRNTKRVLARGTELEFSASKIRESLYRPFCIQRYFFERAFSEDTYQFPKIFPRPACELENFVICVPSAGGRAEYWALQSNKIVNLSLTSLDATQCFPFYTYDEDGSNRRENITDWALDEFRTKVGDKKLTKWDIFHYTYAVLHHPQYRTKYAANLRRELPRIPVPEGRPNDFFKLAELGKKLAELHVNYEDAPEYPLQEVWKDGSGLNMRVEKMKLTKDKRAVIYNQDLTLDGIPPEAFEYRLGNRSAIDWIIDQYQVSTDKRSGITNDPNRPDDEEYIIRLLKKVVTVSVETVRVVKGIEGVGVESKGS